MLQSQRFQLSALKVSVKGKIPEKIPYLGVIAHDEVNVRESAAARWRSPAVTGPGTPVIAQELSGNWARVQLPDGRAVRSSRIR